jgi:hypothetical protein
MAPDRPHLRFPATSAAGTQRRSGGHADFGILPVILEPVFRDPRRKREALWRGGRPSGQRAIVAAIENLSHECELAGSFAVSMTGGPVKVLVRPGAAGSL